MSNQRYPDEFKFETVKKVAEQGCSVADVARRLRATAQSLYV